MSAAQKRAARGARAAGAESRRRQRPRSPTWISRDPAVVAAYVADPLVHDRDRAAAGALHRRRRRDGAWRARRAGSVPTLLLYAGSDRCVAPRRQRAPSPRRRRAALVDGATFEPLFHEIFNEPEQARSWRAGAWLERATPGRGRRPTLDAPPPTEEPAMNARDPLQPIQTDEAERARPLRRPRLGRRDRPGAHRLHRGAGEEPDVRRRLAGARLHRARGPRRRELGRAQAGAGAEARGRPPRGPHAGDLLRRAGDAPAATSRRRHDLPLRPPRQAARVQRLAQRPRPVDAEATRTACSTAAAAPTTATRSTPRSRRSRRSTGRASRGRAASA